MDIINLHNHIEKHITARSGVIWEVKTTLLLPGCSETVQDSHDKKQLSQREWSSFEGEEACN